MTRGEIKSEAIRIYTDYERSEGSRYNDMQRFLWDRVKQGNLSAKDKCMMAADIMRDEC